MFNNDCRTTLSYLLAGALSAGLALTASGAAAQDASASTDGASSINPSALEEIIVTAERRSENVQNVATSITVRDGEKLAQSGKFTLDQILEGIPGVSGGAARGSGGAGSDTPGTGVVIRGIASNTALAGTVISTVPATATYVDDVYGGIGGDYDIARVEVLRGPQGTLYGRSATAGVVATKTKDPELGAFGGMAAGEVGNYNLQRLAAAINVPIGENLAVRAAGLRYSRDGYYAEQGDARSETAGKIKVLFKPSETFSALVGVAFQNDTSHTGELGGYSPIGQPHTVLYQDVPLGTGHSKFRQYWGQFNLDIAGATLTYVPAFRTWKQDAIVYNKTGSTTFQQAVKTPKDHFHTQELRLASQPGRLTWQVGGFYYDNDISASNLNLNYPALTLNSNRVTSKETQDYGVFGEGTFRFNDALRFTGGIRYDLTKLTIDETYTRTAGSLTITDAKRKYKNTTYKARLEGNVTPDNLLYASISTGFLPGDVSIALQGMGAQARLVVQDLTTETLTSYEIGTKNRFFGGKLQVNAGAYYYKYGGYQLGGVNVGTTSDPNLVTLSSPAEVKGAELEVTYQLSPSDRFGFSGQFSDAKFVDSSDDFKKQAALLQIPNVSKWAAEVYYGHRFDLANGQNVSVNLNGRYRSSVLLNTITPSLYNDGYLPYLKEGDQYVADANVIWAFSDKGSVSVYIRNITDNRYKNSSQVIAAPAPPGGVAPPASNIARQSDPRTFGATFNLAF
ncbi:TonB-dependent receptor [Novosphingobium sp. Rr 2-17]|uniref:TonB-dependent receptor n=1 Tax=Novosphingobium sp. Rr 2-17 TaxID=555793 RepID=UPI0002698BA1|nr:TonB-dependent receptor [Novosphingobium sp. Rr 2-17]EIZ80072.1 TonB-dependent receptor [Novosphingobium sp. Rr 2-17]